ncbi:MAG: hypothetical protein MJ120_01330 [Clostridia bacterium]|nr:hypothetical protein [Clostridia bacterium]
MEIKLFSFIKGEEIEFADCKDAIVDCVTLFTSKEEEFYNFSSPKKMLIAGAQALKKADAIIFAVPLASYNSMKKTICSVFEMETESNEEIYENLLPAFKEKKITKTAFENNCLFPKEADIFPVSDFRCCGFAITEGTQSIILLPLDDEKTNEIVYGSLYNFIGEMAGFDNMADISMLKCAVLATKLSASLRKGKSRLAFTDLGGIPLIEESLYHADRENKTMFVADKPEPRLPSQTIQDYIITTAQKTRLDTKADYACAVSSAFASNTDDSTFIYAAVADENDTAVKKLYLNDGEDPKSLYQSAVEEVFLSALNKVKKGVEKKRKDNRKVDKFFRQKMAFITAAAVAGAVGLCAILAMVIQ